jgi:hypothetical protein
MNIEITIPNNSSLDPQDINYQQAFQDFREQWVDSMEPYIPDLTESETEDN